MVGAGWMHSKGLREETSDAKRARVRELKTENREGIMTVATATEANIPKRYPGAPTAADPRRW